MGGILICLEISASGGTWTYRLRPEVRAALKAEGLIERAVLRRSTGRAGHTPAISSQPVGIKTKQLLFNHCTWHPQGRETMVPEGLRVALALDQEDVALVAGVLEAPQAVE